MKFVGVVALLAVIIITARSWVESRARVSAGVSTAGVSAADVSASGVGASGVDTRYSEDGRAVTPRGKLAAEENNAIAIFENVSPSVVFITNTSLQRDIFTRNVYERPRGTGSGFVWDNEGRILTNYHVIVDANRVKVTMADGSTWKASLVGVAPDKDLAVLKIDAPREKLKPISVGASARLKVGQTVYAIGNPFGLDKTMTSGIVSALNREIESLSGRVIQGVIQTDAAINPGNSGGPLLDSSGRLIGINTQIVSPSGVSAGVGFAVPVETVNQAASQIIKYGKVIRPGLGVSLARDEVARQLGLEGALIVKVTKGSGADKAGLKGSKLAGRQIILGDIIKSIDGQPIRSFADLGKIMDTHKVGDTVTLEVFRGGALKKIAVTLSEIN